MRWVWGMGLLGVIAGAVVLLAGEVGVAADDPPTRLTPPQEALRASLTEQAAILEGVTVAVSAAESEPLLHPSRAPRFAATIQHLRGCPKRGDAIVTVEHPDDLTWVVAHRGGVPCFRLPFATDDDGPADVRPVGTVLPDGSAGPLAIVFGKPLPSAPLRDGANERRTEVHLIVVSWTGDILLDRAVERRTVSRPWAGESLELAPLVWDGDTLAVWASARSWAGEARQCLGSLLSVPRRGAIAVAEGIPCEPLGARDVDGDGRVELHGATGPQDSAATPWEAFVTPAGDFAAAFSDRAGEGTLLLRGAGGPAVVAPAPDPLRGPRLTSWPWIGEAAELPGGKVRFAWDHDGDGIDEAVLEEDGEARIFDALGRRIASLPGEPLAGRPGELVVREPFCGVAAMSLVQGRRCGPAPVAGLEEVLGAGGAFDWTADGTEDVTLVGTSGGRLVVVAWAEDDLSFERPVDSIEELPPLHQAPRALSLSSRGGPEVLVHTQRGFAVLGVPGGELRWEGLREDGVLDAWALPCSGSSTAGTR